MENKFWNRVREERERERRERLFWVILIIIGVCAVIFCFAHFSEIFKTFLPDKTLTLTNSTKDSTEIYNALAVEVNAINNILTWGSFIVAALTIAAAVFGIIGVTAFREETRTKLDNFKHSINDFSEKIERAENITNQIESIKESLVQQERYIDHTADYLFKATYSNLSLMSNQQQAKQLLDSIFHELQIAILYRTSLDESESTNNDNSKETAFKHLEKRGTMADIPHLEYVVKHDPKEHIRRRAIEVIAIIRNRENSL